MTVQFSGSLAPKAATELTIASGVVTVTQLKHTLAAQTGTTDNLDTITIDSDIDSGYEGIVIITAASGDTITLKHSTGNIELSGAVDVAVAAGQIIILIYDGTNWRDITSTPSGGTIDARYFAVAGDIVEGDMTFADGADIVFDTTTGTEIGTAADQKWAFHGATPIVQPTTGHAAAVFAANSSGISNDTATFDGYTLGQVVKALRDLGVLT